MAGQHARISHLVKTIRQDKSSRNEKPTRNELPSQKGRQRSEAAPSRGKKKPFGNKPIFNKRPNFGDKPSPRMPGSDKPKSGASRRPTIPKKRSSQKKQCIPARWSRHIEATAINIDAHIWPINFLRLMRRCLIPEIPLHEKYNC